MSKYGPLSQHLKRQTLAEFTMTFREIEALLGAALPGSASRPQWWANVKGSSSHVQREAWRSAGYDAFLINGGDRVRFKRVRG